MFYVILTCNVYKYFGRQKPGIRKMIPHDNFALESSSFSPSDIV